LLEQGKTQPDAFTAAFAQSFGNRTLVFDGVLKSRPMPDEGATEGRVGAAAPNEYVLDWVWLDDSGRQVEIDLGQCKFLAGLDLGNGRRVILGAEIDRLEAEPGGGSQWKLRVKPETVTLLTAVGPLRRFQWPNEPPYQPVLEEQRGFLGFRE
jgi:hypothetical protein